MHQIRTADLRLLVRTEPLQGSSSGCVRASTIPTSQSRRREQRAEGPSILRLEAFGCFGAKDSRRCRHSDSGRRACGVRGGICQAWLRHSLRKGELGIGSQPSRPQSDILLGALQPMATSISECISIVKSVKENEVIFGIGHVLRYSPYNVAIKEIIQSGILGEIVNIQHIEPVGREHFSHSYVRGNWRNKKDATFSLMAKSCHDIDIIKSVSHHGPRS